MDRVDIEFERIRKLLLDEVRMYIANMTVEKYSRQEV